MKAKCKRTLFPIILLYLWLPLMTAGCAAPGTVKLLQPADVPAAGKTAVVQTGDVAEINYLCRLKSGEVAAASLAIAETEPKANIFVAKRGTHPVSITAVKPDEPLPERFWPKAFDEEIRERLMRKITGMKEGETRQVELTAQMIPARDEQSGFKRLAKMRTRPREERIPRSEYESRARKAPEVGQAVIKDPALPGRVESFDDKEVVIRYSAKAGNVVDTPFGQGRIREEGENYKIDIDAKEGRLVRTGNSIGRIVSVTDTVITVDSRHPFGYEALFCDVTVRGVTEAEAKKEGAEKK